MEWRVEIKTAANRTDLPWCCRVRLLVRTIAAWPEWLVLIALVFLMLAGAML